MFDVELLDDLISCRIIYYCIFHFHVLGMVFADLMLFVLEPYIDPRNFFRYLFIRDLVHFQGDLVTLDQYGTFVLKLRQLEL